MGEGDESDRRRTLRGTKGVNLPPDAWDGAKGLCEELMSLLELVDDGDVRSGGLVGHDDAPDDELDLTLAVEVLEVVATLFRGVAPPALEVSNLHKDELARGVVLEVLDDGVVDVLHLGRVVLLERDDPADVVVRVGQHKDLQELERAVRVALGLVFGAGLRLGASGLPRERGLDTRVRREDGKQQDDQQRPAGVQWPVHLDLFWIERNGRKT